MLTLIIMRHAKSSWDDPHATDHDRCLNARGRANSRALGHWFRKSKYVPDQVICSSARRAIETLQGLHLSCDVRTRRSLYHAPPDQILTVLRTAKDRTVLTIGHNPGCAAFCDRIVKTPPETKEFAKFPTGATLIARFDLGSWSDLDWRTGEVETFIVPKQIPQV